MSTSSDTPIQNWDPNVVYSTPGTKVTEQGGVYSNNWWTRGDDPLIAGNDSPNGPWTMIVPPNHHPAAPNAPTGLTSAFTSDTRVALTWDPATVPGIGTVSGYDVYQNGKKIGTTTSTTYAVSGLTASTAYQFSVDAVDATGTSAKSAALAVRTSAPQISSGKTFSPYVDMGLAADENLLAIAAQTGHLDYTLAFLQSSGPGTLGWSGVGTIDNDGFPDNPSLPTIQSQVRTLQSEGGTITIAIGGASGTDPAMVATSAAQLQAEFQSVIDRYGVTHLDFDIEGAPVADQASITLRDKALVGLRKANPGLHISFTLPVLPTGLDHNGVNVLASAARDGVQIDLVNIMAMDYGGSVDNHGAMGDNAIAAAKATEAQILAAHLTAKVGITPMIGMNDVTTEIFTLADAQKLEAFAAATPLVADIGMWSIGRDNGSGAGHKYASATDSSIAQTAFQFTSIFSKVTVGVAPPATGTTGNDRISIGATPALVDGKAGIDVLKVQPNATVALSDANFKNFEAVVVQDGADLDMSAVTTFFGSVRSASTAAGGATITGTRSNDRIAAGAGHDVVDGGAGNDYLYAGKGPDTFMATMAHFGRDRFMNVDLDHDTFHVSTDFAADGTAAHLHFLAAGANTLVYGDHGKGSAADVLLLYGVGVGAVEAHRSAFVVAPHA